MASRAVALCVLALASDLVSGARVFESRLDVDAKFPAWKKAFCIGHPDVVVSPTVAFSEDECSAFEEEHTGTCREWHDAMNSDSGVSQKIQFFELQRKCKIYLEEKSKAEEKVTHDAGEKMIKEAARTCQADVYRVCMEYGCPVENLVTGGTQACEEKCTTALQMAFFTGEMECDAKDTWFECNEKKAEELAAGRSKALEALVREHFVKCVCVNRPSNQDVCYQGDLGLQQGPIVDGTPSWHQKWCEWHETPSWMRILEQAGNATMPTATC